MNYSCTPESLKTKWFKCIIAMPIVWLMCPFIWIFCGLAGLLANCVYVHKR